MHMHEKFGNFNAKYTGLDLFLSSSKISLKIMRTKNHKKKVLINVIR